ncbi:MAG: DNA alkylation repair protein [Patescibacteria group bacterium]
MVNRRLVKGIIANFKKQASPAKARVLQRFFKTGLGEYGEGDVFWGLTVPQIRNLVKEYGDLLDFGEIRHFLKSKVHEQRLFALLVLVKKFEAADEKSKQQIYNFYLRNCQFINNWDLVDLSADKIVGAYLWRRPKDVLFRLALSKNIWQRRIAVLATFYFIKQGDSKETLFLAGLLLKDQHDLIQKAVGWMLREVGKRCSIDELKKFLDKHASVMPRTMLRYSIERLPLSVRQRYLKAKDY